MKIKITNQSHTLTAVCEHKNRNIPKYHHDVLYLDITCMLTLSFHTLSISKVLLFAFNSLLQRIILELIGTRICVSASESFGRGKLHLVKSVTASKFPSFASGKWKYLSVRWWMHLASLYNEGKAQYMYTKPTVQKILQQKAH